MAWAIDSKIISIRTGCNAFAIIVRGRGVAQCEMGSAAPNFLARFLRRSPSRFAGHLGGRVAHCSAEPSMRDRSCILLICQDLTMMHAGVLVLA
jgi:hypothetical protein